MGKEVQHKTATALTPHTGQRQQAGLRYRAAAHTGSGGTGEGTRRFGPTLFTTEGMIKAAGSNRAHERQEGKGEAVQGWCLAALHWRMVREKTALILLSMKNKWGEKKNVKPGESSKGDHSSLL